MTESLSGGCACGALRYRCATAPITVVNCYCTDCQKVGGAPMTHVVFRSDSISWTGEPGVHTTKGDSGRLVTRRFCRDCGAAFVTDLGVPGLSTLPAPSLDDSSGIAPMYNLWTRSRPAWAPIDSALTSHEKGFPARS